MAIRLEVFKELAQEKHEAIAVRQREDGGIDIVTMDEDPCPEDPRDSFECRILSFSRRYDVGHAEHPEDFKSPEEFERWAWRNRVLYLPLYLFSHGVVSVSTDCDRYYAQDAAAWDWGQVGYVYMTRERVRQVFGVKKVTDKIKKRAYQLMRQEIAILDQYLSEPYYMLTRRSYDADGLFEGIETMSSVPLTYLQEACEWFIPEWPELYEELYKEVKKALRL